MTEKPVSIYIFQGCFEKNKINRSKKHQQELKELKEFYENYPEQWIYPGEKWDSHYKRP